MTWKKINRVSDGSFLAVYDATARGETGAHWNHTHCAPEAVHTVIPDRPAEYYIFWDEIQDKWAVDIDSIRAQKEAELEQRAWKKLLAQSPEGAELETAKTAVRAAKTVAGIEAVKISD